MPAKMRDILLPLANDSNIDVDISGRTVLVNMFSMFLAPDALSVHLDAICSMMLSSYSKIVLCAWTILLFILSICSRVMSRIILSDNGK